MSSPLSISQQRPGPNDWLLPVAEPGSLLKYDGLLGKEMNDWNELSENGS